MTWNDARFVVTDVVSVELRFSNFLRLSVIGDKAGATFGEKHEPSHHVPRTVGQTLHISVIHAKL